ncbi:Hypothetical predicted protein [Pelobates cultripes]|uniref:Uncharacterized protein n=1 Tax=Pelobates cultripes TaxID=61616 RepID=A0AAD1SYM9_PELCU|nr:Hypothetical predicted protein [Pelobates cultripes]
MEGSGDKHVFQCPLNFEPVADYDGAEINEPDTEVWLIKAPSDFTPESFNSHRLPLSGYKTQKVKVEGIRKLYHVQATHGASAPCRAFLPQDVDAGLKFACAPPFQGIITVAEAHADSTALHPIPDRPSLKMPQNLKQRYHPFGADSPITRQISEGQFAATPIKKKKKSKKRKLEEATV